MLRARSLVFPLAASFGISSNGVRHASSAASVAESQYDLIVIGGGSGGLAAAKRSAEYGKRVCIIEHNAWGGTCVNVGCVPKKLMYNAAHISEVVKQSGHYGYSIPHANFDWANLKRSRDTYIKRLNNIYIGGLNRLDIDRVENEGYATFSDDGKSILVGDRKLSADKVVIAVGGTPNSLEVPGDEYAIDSDGFFAMEAQPKKCAVIGAGYIAVELAGVMHALGTNTSLFVRGDKALRNFDEMLSTNLDKAMKHDGITVRGGSIIKELTKEADGTITIHLQDGTSHGGYDCVIKATGRTPVTNKLNLPKSVKTLPSGHIVVDEYQNTSVPGILSLGDCTDKKIDLTPMAIAAGRRLGDRLFGGPEYKDSKADYTMVPTVVFSHPVMGTIGLTEKEALAKYGADNIKIYNSSFVNLWYGPFYNGEAGEKPMSRYKVITQLPTEKIVGMHLIGDASDEVLQGFGVAIKMGATKADLDACIAIHPTAAEELVTLPVWGKAPLSK
jgi:glutathione reductase (NADPH)